MTKVTMRTTIPKAMLFAVVTIAACKNDKATPDKPTGTSSAAVSAAPSASASGTPQASPAAEVERGKYLVNAIGCNDCHTPLAVAPGAPGPAPDMTKMLSGHQASLEMPPVPKLPAGPWLMVVAGTNTAWAGPWGVSYTANITPDPDTGIGNWTRQNFIDTIKNGRHMGAGRPLLPPMPWESFKNMTNDDLGAIYAYLKSIPALKNKVPEPRPPAAAPPAGKK